MVAEPKTLYPPSHSVADEIATGEIPVYITKSNFFRVVHVDGVYGGGTPTQGNIMMTLYSHRVPFPSKTVTDANGDEIISKRDAIMGIEQEYEVSLVMNLVTARGLLLWLNNTIKNTESLLKQVQANQQK